VLVQDQNVPARPRTGNDAVCGLFLLDVPPLMFYHPNPLRTVTVYVALAGGNACTVPVFFPTPPENGARLRGPGHGLEWRMLWPTAFDAGMRRA